MADAHKALELSLREAVHLRSGEIGVAHIVLGIVRADGAAARVLPRLGVFPGDVRRDVLAQLRRAA